MLKGIFPLSPLSGLLILPATGLAATSLNFDPAMLSGDADSVVDLSRFTSQGAQMPGRYEVDIYLNNTLVANRAVNFVSAERDDTQEQSGSAGPYVRDGTGLIPCLTVQALKDMGVNVSAFEGLSNLPKDACIQPGRFIPQAWTAFDFPKMRLDISIPQAAMTKRPYGWIAPERWDDGINAAMASWQFSGSNSHGRYGNSSSQFLNLNSGINIGPWRLRDKSTWSRYQSRYQDEQRWRHLSTYLQRAVIPLRSELILGDSTTSSDVFDGFSFRGIQLATDETMYPEAMRGFAPAIRGTANSNAEISVRQNGNEIYRTNVAAGEFVIKDVMPLTLGGDLEVAVKESDGSVRLFTVPYSSVPVLQREGHARYSVTAGHYRGSGRSYDDPAFAQATLLWGGPHNITTYGGGQLAENYRAAALGAGLNMGSWGALSADITHADSTLADNSRHKGQSIRFQYGRSLVSTGTTLQLAGYRYSTRGFHTLAETALRGMSGWKHDEDRVDAAGRRIKESWVNYYSLYSNKRELLQANISQRIADVGSLTLTGSRQSYWNDAASTSLQTSFSSAWGRVSYSVSYGHTRYSGQPKADNSLWVSLSVPLGSATGQDLWATYSASRDGEGNTAHLVGMSGTALKNKNLSWSVSQGYSERDSGSGDASAGYQGTYGNVSAGYGYSKNYSQWRYSASGSAIVHGGGVTLGQPLGNTNVLIAAPGAANVPVTTGTGVRTDWRGYAVVPYASQYRENRIGLDVSQLDDSTDIDNPVSRVVPTQGALVKASFQARTGLRALITLVHKDKPLPFGTVVTTENSTGLVDDEGQVYLSGMQSKGKLIAQWGNMPHQQCTVNYTLSDEAQKTALTRSQFNCQ